MQKKFGIAVVAALLASPLAVQAQSAGGGESGSDAAAARAAEDVGGIVGGVTGGVAEGAAAVLGDEDSHRFHDFAMGERRSSYRYEEQLRPGVRLPQEGVTYYEVPREYGVNPRLRYTVVNDHAVLVDPATREVVQVID